MTPRRGNAFLECFTAPLRRKSTGQRWFLLTNGHWCGLWYYFWWQFDITLMTSATIIMGLLPDTQNCGLRMHRECRERFTHHRLQRKPLVSDLSMRHARAVMHVGIANPRGGEHVPGIPGACATRNFAYLVSNPWRRPVGPYWDPNVAGHVKGFSEFLLWIDIS